MREKDATSGQPLDRWARGRTVGPKPGNMRLGRGKERNVRKNKDKRRKKEVTGKIEQCKRTTQRSKEKHEDKAETTGKGVVGGSDKRMRGGKH